MLQQRAKFWLIRKAVCYLVKVNLLLTHLKNLDLLDKRIIFLTYISAGDTVLDMKKRVANILGTSADCVTLVHSGFKMTSNNQKFSEVGFYDNDNLLAIVNGVCDY